MQRRQQQQQATPAATAGEDVARGVASECSEGYDSECSSSSDCGSGGRGAEVAAATMREWGRQHGWLHSPGEI